MVQVQIRELDGARAWELSMISRVSVCAWDADGTKWDRHGDCDCAPRQSHSLWRSPHGALAHEHQGGAESIASGNFPGSALIEKVIL
jgi:hypothetical protein